MPNAKFWTRINGVDYSLVHDSNNPGHMIALDEEGNRVPTEAPEPEEPPPPKKTNWIFIIVFCTIIIIAAMFLFRPSGENESRFPIDQETPAEYQRNTP